MSRSVRVVWDDALTGYDFGPGHPLAPVRVELTMALARELGVLDAVEVAGCVPATDDELALVHGRGYIEAVRRASAAGRPERAHGIGTEDTPAFAGMHEASALITGATLAAARAEKRKEVRTKSIAKVLHRKIRAAVDPTTAAERAAAEDYVETERALPDPRLVGVAAYPARTAVPGDRFAMAGGCYTLSAGLDRFGPYYFKATRLGGYLLHTAGGELAVVNGTVRPAAKASPAADWTATKAGTGFRFDVGAGKALTVAGGKLVPGAGSIVGAGVAGAGTLAIGRSAIAYFVDGPGNAVRRPELRAENPA